MISENTLRLLNHFFTSPKIIGNLDFRQPGLMSFKFVEYDNRKVFNIPKLNNSFDGYIHIASNTRNASTFTSALKHTRILDSLVKVKVKEDIYFISNGLILNQEYKPLVIYTSDTNNRNPILYVSPSIFYNNTKVIEKGIMKFLPEYCARFRIKFIISMDIDDFIEYTKTPTVNNFSDCIWQQIKDNSELYENCKNANIEQLL